jgi:proteasome assembly chaperone (PAC2) family protein
VTVPAVGVVVAPLTSKVVVGGTQQITATVTNAADTSVKWSVQEASGATVTASGGLFSPTVTGSYHVVATSVVDTSKSGTAVVTVPVVGISVAPLTSKVVVGAVLQFTSTVTNAADTSVKWSLQEASGATISASGGLFSPTVAGTYHVVGASVVDTSKSATAVVTVVAHPASLGFAAVPLNAVAGGTINVIKVDVLDSQGAITTAPTTVTLQMTGGLAGATLAGTLVQPAQNGEAAFSDLVISDRGSGYTLLASSPGVASATSSPFSVGCPGGNGPFRLGGVVTGVAGSGLVLRAAGEADLSVPAGATTFAFATKLAPGNAYSVAAASQPTAPNQACTVSNGAGVVGCGDVATVMVSCVNSYRIGGTVSGLVGTGLELQTQGEPVLTIPPGATSFVFGQLLPQGSAYAVTPAAQPTGPWQTCAVNNGSGNATSDVSSVAVSCTANTYALGGSVSRLFGDSLVLSAAGQPDLTVGPNAKSFAFANKLASGAAWSVNVKQQPQTPALTCTASPASGTVGGTDVSVAVSCVCPAGTTCLVAWANWTAAADAPPAGSYTDNRDGTVTDASTGLVWQQAATQSTYGWQQAKDYCALLALAGGGWRLPSRVELVSLVDHTKYSPSINSTAFPGTPVLSFWSSSVPTFVTGFAWMVVFSDGNITYLTTNNSIGVRCVR